nr:MAG TPA: hypothetical protein [Caudoviricetes sp.]
MVNLRFVFLTINNILYISSNKSSSSSSKLRKS